MSAVVAETSALSHSPAPSKSQRNAIEAAPGPLLVLAGPGAGKTFCLIERIYHLITAHNIPADRICAFTFTNKAAGEITQRLETRLGNEQASKMTRGTIHAFCADLLRKHGTQAGIDTGFGIADEEYQLSVLRRIEGPRRWHRSTLNHFSAYRFRGDGMRVEDLRLFDLYEKYLAKRNVLDFDTLVIKTADLLQRADFAERVRKRWDVILVDEFQDLNPVQYRVVRALAADHRHVFAVGDDEQAIYSWAGADPRVFMSFFNDFEPEKVYLEENRRCPRDVFALARSLVSINTQQFADRIVPRADRESRYPVRVVSFADDSVECQWLVADLRHDRGGSEHRWGDVALLYRKHEIGERLEAALLSAGIPCRMPRGHALSDDAAIAYVIAAARVISSPDDEVLRQEFFRVVLPGSLFDEAIARAGEARMSVHRQLHRMAAQLPKADENARRIRRALADWRNLIAVGRQHTALASLIQELLSRRVGPMPSVLDIHHEDISDPASLKDVFAVATQLRFARKQRTPVHIEASAGVAIPLKAMLRAVGVEAFRGDPPPAVNAIRLSASDARSHALPLVIFKAAQLLEMDSAAAAYSDFTAVDIETTDKKASVAEIVEIAAVKVRRGRVVEEFSTLVKPGVSITAGAMGSHGITDAEVANAPSFAAVWPGFRDFCGGDIVVAHNGYDFDFPVLARMVRALSPAQKFELCTFDSLPLARDLFPTSRKLVDLARHFSIETGKSHRALHDSRTLAQVLIKLGQLREVRSRKTALVNLLDHLGVALALSEEKTLDAEAILLRNLSRPFALGRYSDCLDYYEMEADGDTSVPSVDELIDKLGGRALMEQIRTEKTADERYPAAMQRLRRLIADIPAGTLGEQLQLFLERVALSKWDGHEPTGRRVNLLTLHSTKGLEFSRVYVVGAEDDQLPGGSPSGGPTLLEIEEARRLLYVGMTRTIDRLTITRTEKRGEKPTGGHRFLDEMGLPPLTPT